MTWSSRWLMRSRSDDAYCSTVSSWSRNFSKTSVAVSLQGSMFCGDILIPRETGRSRNDQAVWVFGSYDGGYFPALFVESLGPLSWKGGVRHFHRTSLIMNFYHAQLSLSNKEDWANCVLNHLYNFISYSTASGSPSNFKDRYTTQHQQRKSCPSRR